MMFFCTKGKPAVYLVSIYNWNVEDKTYFHYLKDAKAFFERAKHMPHENGTVISIYDIKKDIRKAFYKVKE